MGSRPRPSSGRRIQAQPQYPHATPLLEREYSRQSLGTHVSAESQGRHCYCNTVRDERQRHGNIATGGLPSAVAAAAILLPLWVPLLHEFIRRDPGPIRGTTCCCCRTPALHTVPFQRWIVHLDPSRIIARAFDHTALYIDRVQLQCLYCRRPLATDESSL
jgi:hypothetical protein